MSPKSSKHDFKAILEHIPYPINIKALSKKHLFKDKVPKAPGTYLLKLKASENPIAGPFKKKKDTFFLCLFFCFFSEI